MKILVTFCIISACTLAMLSFKKSGPGTMYISLYGNELDGFRRGQQELIKIIESSDLNDPLEIEKIVKQINITRESLKMIDFWLRYLEPTTYKKINGPLPVEWETEVFEKFEKPYKRIGAGLTLSYLYCHEENLRKDSLLGLLRSSLESSSVFSADSVTRFLNSFDHFYFCNRLYLLNLAAVYTTGFECPDSSRIIPELKLMMHGVELIYKSFNSAFPEKKLNKEYTDLYLKTLKWVDRSPGTFSNFDHYTFIRDFVNPLFRFNQQLIKRFGVVSKSFVDYTLNDENIPIFNKKLYRAQNAKGIFLRVADEKELTKIEKAGKLLFYDPILSGNNRRSCASCHKPTEYFTDTSVAAPLKYNHVDYLPRNSPSLVNATNNHLLMVDGRHLSLQDQTKAVLTNAEEMNGSEQEIIQKVLSCAEYKKIFSDLLKYTPWETEITFDHIVSAITTYYAKFSNYYSPFDDAMNGTVPVSGKVRKGFNVFMSKAQCATCHFVPQFNGVKPPYVGSEFEVLGVPTDTSFKNISGDVGRYKVNVAEETMHAFRTGSLRNIRHTGPYMHNGVFKTLGEVIDFYDAGGGQGKGLTVNNQTLSSDSLHLTKQEKKDLISFLNALNENIVFETPPEKLPVSTNRKLNSRKVGGEY